MLSPKKQKIMPFILTVIIWAFGVTSEASVESVFRMGTFDHFPYHYNKDGVLKGDAVRIVECVMKAMNQKFSVKEYPQVRGIQLLKSGELDGLLSYQTYQDSSLQSIASDPIVFERWNIYSAMKSDEAEKVSWRKHLGAARLGSVRGSSIDIWLQENKLNPQHRLSNFDQLVKMLYQGRIDAFVADERSTGETINETFQGHSFRFQRRFITFSPLSIHFSKVKYADGGFASRFNSHISSCHPDVLELKHSEGELVIQKAKAIFYEYLNSHTIKDKVIRSNLNFRKNADNFQVEAFEQQWKNDRRKGDGALVRSVVKSEVADFLRDIMSASDGLILEIIVMNKYGFNVAATGITSDYYQWDEKKYTKSFLLNHDSIHLGRVEFDESSSNFGAQVSFTLSKKGVKLGAVTLTVDVYKAFQ